MTVIDADAHVIENESTWDYMLESERQFKPKVVSATSGKDPFDYWMVDGRVIPRNNVGRDLPVAAREMTDLTVRIKHMDELGIDHCHPGISPLNYCLMPVAHCLPHPSLATSSTSLPFS